MRTFSFKITRTCHKVLGHWSVWVFAVAVSDAADSTGTFNSNSNNSGKPFCSEYKPWLEKPTVTWEPNGTCMAATYEGHDTLLSRSHTCKCQNSLAKKLGLCYTPVPDGCTFKSDNLLQNAINSILEDTCVIGDSLARHLAMAFLRRVDRPYEERDQFYYQSHVMFHHRTHKPLTLDEGEVCSEKAKAMSTDEGYKQLCTNAVAKDGTYDFEESMCNPLETSYNNAAGQKVGLRELSAKHHCDWQYHRTLEQNLWVKFLEEKKCHRLVYIGGHHWWKEPGAHENYAMLVCI
ncbi:hypothetical protein SARC_11695 [Sphaeroforma arctica JP610]|uniref:Uncharacterized protein n=1 Tax=Sphaeroforma arctica JP610 TaxID=667725 RepID=A0A0L0FH28_9EUKA|nr:hypothetical protein SARC_11695 [Sphaeroforma arctica JP610]KNC75786.1 hypothetical protein SARC_11695 [Sphaeroforma arctica JP610]|eukprot:XP_014149688.1 hypothetical protein SARC_11695 [Sphaeroforma arctica JP610]